MTENINEFDKMGQLKLFAENKISKISFPVKK